MTLGDPEEEDIGAGKKNGSWTCLPRRITMTCLIIRKRRIPQC
jgi:hypothetical protein